MSSAPADMAARHRANLTELAELGMALARDVQGRAMAATDKKAKADLTLAFHRVSRSVRQTMALEARLERDLRLALREAAGEAARATLERVQNKRALVRTAVERLVWTEVEDDEAAENLVDEVGAFAFALSQEEGFLDLPVEACIARLRADLGLAAADTTDDGETEGAIWKGSG